jgi:uncharacterized membrane protein YgcG
MDEYKASLDKLTKQYNQAIQALESAFELEKGRVGRVNKLKEQYSGRYTQLVHEYRQKRKVVIAEYKQAHPEWTKARKMWGWIFVIGILTAMTCCKMALPDSPEPEATTESVEGTTSALSGSDAEVTYWNADNIPIPYLQDSTQYVSNPDRVLSQQTVDNMNVTLQRLNLDLGVQSVVIVVNHIENDDPFRLAQDVGNKYGVGHGDRGLMVVCGYQDHSLNISPGRSLEGDLTDVECRRLEQQYAVPFMKREQPDSAMYYLTEAIYSTLEKKQLPVASSLMAEDAEDEDDAALVAVGLTTFFLTLWFIFFLNKNGKYHWLGLVGMVPLLANPFYVAPQSSGGGFGGFGGGGHSGSGGFSGGSFGGGSFGGGGATSRW